MKRTPAEYIAQLYYDSCVYDEQAMQALVKRVGASQVVMGSDFPIGEKKPVQFVESCGFTAAETALILRGNAQRLLGLS